MPHRHPQVTPKLTNSPLPTSVMEMLGCTQVLFRASKPGFEKSDIQHPASKQFQRDTETPWNFTLFCHKNGKRMFRLKARFDEFDVTLPSFDVTLPRFDVTLLFDEFSRGTTLQKFANFGWFPFHLFWWSLRRRAMIHPKFGGGSAPTSDHRGLVVVSRGVRQCDLDPTTPKKQQRNNLVHLSSWQKSPFIVNFPMKNGGICP